MVDVLYRQSWRSFWTSLWDLPVSLIHIFLVRSKTSGLGTIFLMCRSIRISILSDVKMWNWIDRNLLYVYNMLWCHLLYVYNTLWCHFGLIFKVLNLMLPCLQYVIILCFFINSEIKQYNSTLRILSCLLCVISQPNNIDGYLMNLI
jgi:hypothetical protein